MLLTDLLPQLERGYVYLTLGTIEQICWIARALDLEPDLLIEPTGHEVRKALEYPSFRDEAIVIKAKELKGSGIKGTTTGEFALPTDSFFYVHPSRFAFISICELDGEVSEKLTGEAKKLEGGCYKILDLRRLDNFPPYPYINAHELKYSKQTLAGTSKLSYEQQLIDSLNTIQGVLRWGQFTNGELRKWFVTPGIAEPILLKMTRAQALIPFIQPFCRLVEEYWSTGQQSVFLKKFAMWVYMSTEYWAEGGNPGLLRKAAKTGTGVNFYFYPSARAKRNWEAFWNVCLAQTKKKRES